MRYALFLFNSSPRLQVLSFQGGVFLAVKCCVISRQVLARYDPPDCPRWMRRGTCISSWSRDSRVDGGREGSPSSGFWCCVVGRSLSRFPWKAPALVSCSQCGGNLYLEGGHMPLGLISMPFIVKHGDHILFSLTVDPCYQDGEAVCGHGSLEPLLAHPPVSSFSGLVPERLCSWLIVP